MAELRLMTEISLNDLNETRVLAIARLDKS
jgi:hypothetical protein